MSRFDVFISFGPRPVIGLLVLALVAPVTSMAQDASDLAKQAQNPIGTMITLPFENTFNFENGTDDDDFQYILQVQPVIPFGISEKWNLITRPILSVISQPEQAQIPFPPTVVRTGKRTWGLGDMNVSFFFSPKPTTGLVWGVGPVLGVPIATDDDLGSEKWTAGPTGVVVYQTGSWLFGSLVGQMWSFAGDSGRGNVSFGYLQPFLNYNLPRGWYLTSSPMMSANWEAGSDNKLTIPVGGGIGKVFSLGDQRVNTRLVSYYNAERSRGSADWTLQWTFQLLFPK